jgi:hypothetical protein
MDQGLVMVIGMTIAYVASFIGLGLAWWAWRRRVDLRDDETDARDDPPLRGGGGARGRDGGADATGGAGTRGGPDPYREDGT